MKKFGLPLALAAVVGVMLVVFAAGNKPAKPKTDAQLLGKKFEELERKHITEGTTTPIPYNSNPPSSGPHWPSPAPWGMKDTAEADERYVHNLEHGGIWISYRPDIGEAQVQKLKDVFGQLPPSTQFNEVKAVLTARSANPHPIEVVAWGYVMDLDKADSAQINQFYLDHVDKGPELIP